MIQQRSCVSIDWLCGFFEKSRQAFYQICHRKDKRCVNEELIVDYVKAYRQDMPRIGSRKLHHLLQPQLQASGIKCGRDKLFSILKHRDMLIKKRRRSSGITRRTPISRHFPNLIKGMVIDEPEKVWVGDTTSIAIRDGLSYLVLITDAYSKMILGYNYQRTKEKSGPCSALNRAVKMRWYPQRQIIYHTDGGSEFYNKVFLYDLVRYHMQASCTAPSSPLENAVAERINGILKHEFLLLEEKRTFDLVMEKLPEAIRIYNELRPHSSIDYKTPKEAHACSGQLKKRWKMYKTQNARDAELSHIGSEIHQIMNSWQLDTDLKKESSKERNKKL